MCPSKTNTCIIMTETQYVLHVKPTFVNYDWNLEFLKSKVNSCITMIEILCPTRRVNSYIITIEIQYVLQENPTPL